MDQPTLPEKIEAVQFALADDPTNFSLWQELKSLVEQEKAVWTTRYVNDLPDAAFALVLGGGALDEEGRTTPRTLRLLPHHVDGVEDPDDDATVDWPHLINALSRVSQVEDATEEEMTAAEEHLRAHYDRISAEEETEEQVAE